MQEIAFFIYGNKEVHNIFIKLKEMEGSWREIEVVMEGKNMNAGYSFFVNYILRFNLPLKQNFQPSHVLY